MKDKAQKIRWIWATVLKWFDDLCDLFIHLSCIMSYQGLGYHRSPNIQRFNNDGRLWGRHPHGFVIFRFWSLLVFCQFLCLPRNLRQSFLECTVYKYTTWGNRSNHRAGIVDHVGCHSFLSQVGMLMLVPARRLTRLIVHWNPSVQVKCHSLKFQVRLWTVLPQVVRHFLAKILTGSRDLSN